MSRSRPWEAGILLSVRCLRFVERVLPAGAIIAIFWPMAAFRAACELTFATPTIRQFDRLPAALRPRMSLPVWVAYLWRERTRVDLALWLCLWPDRLHKGRWADHGRCVGLDRLEREQARGRPVALALLHFGPTILLAHWMRGRGLPTAGMRWRSSAGRTRYWRYIDRLSDPGGRVNRPIVFDLTQIRGAHEHLRTGGILLMTVDSRQGRWLRPSAGGITLDMATGVLRLAASTGAIVIPCLIAAGPRMSFTIHPGREVPDEFVIDSNHHREACQHLLDEFLAILGRYPGQSHVQLIEHLHPATGDEPSPAGSSHEPAS